MFRRLALIASLILVTTPVEAQQGTSVAVCVVGPQTPAKAVLDEFKAVPVKVEPIRSNRTLVGYCFDLSLSLNQYQKFHSRMNESYQFSANPDLLPHGNDGSLSDYVPQWWIVLK